MHLKGQVERLKEEKSLLLVKGGGGRNNNNNRSFLVDEGEGKKTNIDDRSKGNNTNTLDPHSSQKIDLMKAPSFILRQMSS